MDRRLGSATLLDRPWREAPASLLLSLAAVAVCVALAVLTPPSLSRALLHGWFADAAGAWSLPVAIAAFALFAFLGVPQLALIAAAVLAFGPVWGAVDSWVGTFISALLGFWLGRRLGAGVLSRSGGARIAAILSSVGRNGFAASLTVRVLPSVPFLAVNMIAGALPISVFDYAAGTAIGIVPKIALTAIAGGSLLRLPTDHAVALALFVVAAAAWLSLGLAGFLWLRRAHLVADATPAPAD
jgi:uncharacterized membrane protein YdjX (TVP38/TMEM64 family)